MWGKPAPRNALLPSLFGALLLLAGCSEAEEPAREGAMDGPIVDPAFIASGNPATLAEWGQVQLSGDTLVLGEKVLPYDLNTPLFSDYAHKLRTVWMPENVTANYREGQVLDFPVGTVITKTFYFPVAEGAGEGHVLRDEQTNFFASNRLDLGRIRLIETRVLVHREAGWEAIPYRWNDEQTSAELSRIGAIIPLELSQDGEAGEPFDYVIPNVNECASCHATNSNEDKIWPIGPKVRHINRDFDYLKTAGGTRNQIEQLTRTGFLKGAPDDLASAPKNAIFDDPSATIEQRARSYLDINCSHCHSPIGPADTSGLSLEPDASGPALGTCKVPIAAGAGTGNRRWGIHPGQPDDSILIYRMESDEGDKMMPEIGRSTVHEKGVALVSQWIETLEGSCT